MNIILSDPLYSSFYEKEILSNPLYAFGSLVIFVILGWILCIKFFPLTAISLKKLDYWWLSLSALGLFGLLSNNRILFRKNELEICNARIEVYAKAVMRRIDDPFLCFKFTKSEYSPDNFDDIQKDFNTMCKWKIDVYNRVDSILNENKKIIIDELKIPLVEDNQLKKHIDYLTNNISEYNEYVDMKQTIIYEADYYPYEETLKIISPLFLIIGLSIRFIKTMGEIKLQKRKN